MSYVSLATDSNDLIVATGNSYPVRSDLARMGFVFDRKADKPQWVTSDPEAARAIIALGLVKKPESAGPVVNLTEEQTVAVQVCIAYLGGVCNGAVTWDGHGFSGNDTQFGKSLANQVVQGRSLSPKQLAFAIKMVQKYRKQLFAAVPEALLATGAEVETKTMTRGPRKGQLVVA